MVSTEKKDQIQKQFGIHYMVLKYILDPKVSKLTCVLLPSDRGWYVVISTGDIITFNNGLQARAFIEFTGMKRTNGG